MPSFPRRTARRLALAACCLPLAGWTAARGQEPAPAAPAAELALQAEVEQLLIELDADEFVIRERAVNRLIEIGLPAREPVLEASTGSPSLEVRLRCRTALEQINRLEQQRRLEAFARGDDAQAPDGWEQFRGLAGEDEAARRFFFEMWKGDEELMYAAVQEKNEDLRPLLEARILTELQSRRFNPQVPVEKLGAYLFASLRLSGPLAPNPMNQLISLLHTLQPHVGQEGPARRLLGRWVQQDCDGQQKFQVVRLAKILNLPEGLGVALGELEKGAVGGWLPEYLTAVGQLGGPEHISVLEKFFDRRDGCGGFRRGDGPQVNCEVRDVALAMCVHLSGKKPAEFGFEYAPPDDRSLFLSYVMLGFADDAKRQAAFDKFREFRASQPAEKPEE